MDVRLISDAKEIIGKTIESASLADEITLLRFTDGSVFGLDHEIEQWNECVVSTVVSKLTDDNLFHLGVIDRNEYNRREGAKLLAKREAELAQERKRYEELRAKYEASQ